MLWKMDVSGTWRYVYMIVASTEPPQIVVRLEAPGTTMLLVMPSTAAAERNSVTSERVPRVILAVSGKRHRKRSHASILYKLSTCSERQRDRGARGEQLAAGSSTAV